MKLNMKILSMVIFGVVSSFSLIEASNFHLLNLTGGKLDVRARYVPAGLLLPTMKDASVKNREIIVFKSFRFDWIEFLPDKRIESRDGDDRIHKKCDLWVKLGAKGRCFSRNTDRLDVEIQGSRLVVNQGIIDNNFIPIVYVVTRGKNGLIFTRLSEDRGFLNYLRGVDL